ncbi:MAG: HAMP domain-containing histidine kinase [Ruminococcaceae bacterium]|nr:HAMP domain-containing histidine kinase [Oscillospiraceae bacterium]
MRKPRHSVIFKSMIFFLTTALVAAMLISGVIIVNANSDEFVPTTPFTSSRRLGNYLQGAASLMPALENNLAGRWPEDGIVEMRDLSELAPDLDPGSYWILLDSNLQLLYRDNKTGNIITNIENAQAGLEPDIKSAAFASELLKNNYAFQLDFKNGSIKLSEGLTSADVPPQLQQISMYQAGRDVNFTFVLDTSFSKLDHIRNGSIEYSRQQSWTIYALIILGVSLLLFLAIWIFLIRFAGCQQGTSKIQLSWFDRIYGEIILLAVAVMAAITLSVAQHFFYNYGSFFGSNPLDYLVVVLAFYVAGGILLLSLIRRYKAGILWKQTLTATLLRIGKQFYDNRKLLWKAILLYAAYVFFIFVAIFMLAVTRYDSVFFLLFLAVLVILPAVFILLPASRWVVQFQKVNEAAGNLGFNSFKLSEPIEKLPADLRNLADCLSHTQDRMQQAVAEQLKSERLKTDLISNVSHDLRTPLTSIISYIDLLKQEPEGSVKTAEYLDVLDQKSQRLKILTDNLFEAAKASSGNLPVKMSNVNLNELVSQLSGEYSDRLEAAGLTLVVKQPQTEDGENLPLAISSDGNHVSRILDNLMTNAIKYSLPGTRVYLDLRTEDNNVVFELKNISKDSLNCSVEELSQRFVRGDEARHSEGSGLGLAIASSLAEILGGELNFKLDGDLFKAILQLPR